MYEPILSCFSGSVSDHFAVNSAGYTIVQFSIQLWEDILCVDRSIRNISNSGSLHDVSNHKLPDGLVLRASLAAVGATDIFNVATAMLGTSIILPLFSHISEPEENQQKLC